jgi:CHAT domain-containing protein/Tfp pilus assembly protein PilF
MLPRKPLLFNGPVFREGYITKADEDEIKAEQLLADGWEIKHTGEKQSSANAIVKWDEALKIWRTLKDDYWTAYVGNLLGVMYFNLGEKERAMEYFNEMLPLARAIRDQKGEATILNNIGLFYSNRGENQKAFENFHSALSIFKAIRDRKSEAETLNNIGLVHLNLWENKKALELFNTALPLAISAGDRRGEATSKNNLGGAYSVLGDKQKALEAYTQALKIRESVKDPGGQATSLNNLGLLFLAIGENQKAQIYFENAIPLAKIAEDQSSEATALNGIGLVFSALGENEKALLYFLKALPLVLAAKDDKGQAMTFNNIGVAYSDEGENQKSIQYYDKALALFGIIQDKKGTATTLNNKGLVYSDLGENSKAIEFYYEASSIFREIGDRSGEATSFNNLGWVYSNLKEKSKALELYDKALKHFRDLGERSGQAATLNSTGLVFLYSGEKQRALEYCNQALELFSLIGDRKGEATANNSIGLIYFALDEKQKALEYYNKSFLLFKAFKNRRGEAAVFNNLMVTYKSLGNTNMAVSYGKQSVNVYQELRYFIGNSPKGTQRVFLKTIEDTYRFLAELLLSEKRRPEAVQILEMLKREETSSFEDTGIQRDKPDMTSTLSINESAYFRKIDEFFAEISQPVSELAKLKQLQDQGIVLTTEEKDRLEKLMIEVGTIEKDFPVKMLEFLGEFTNSPAGGSRAEVSLPIQTELAQYGKDTAFVYTLVGEERYRVILVAQETVEDRQFDLKRADLNNKIETFRSELLNKEADPQGTGQELFEILIKPLSKELGRLKIKTLLWSLDGKLRLIPMAALWTGKRYFGQEYRNVNVTVSERTSLNKSVSRDWDILGGGTSEPQIIKSQDNKKFSELKYVGNELRGIVKQNATETGILPGKRLYNADFTNDLLSKELNGKYKVIHFASHFVLNSGKMEDSYLVLGDGDILTLQDIRDNKKRDFLSTELLVLSACQTGVTVRDSNGIEIEGFAYLAQEKGADAILSSLWKVADESTSLFMTEFYRMRKADPSLTKAEIIQKIQNKMMNGEIRGSDISERADDHKDNSISKPTMTKRFKVDQKRPYKHPYFWAPFILIGNWH